MNEKAAVKLKWVEIQVEDNFLNLEGKSGLYLFTLPAFSNAPFYIGTAGEKTGSDLSTRLETTRAYFHKGQRTFIHPDILPKTTQPLHAFPKFWNDLRSESATTNKLFVPMRAALETEKENSRFFWKHCLQKHFCTVENLKNRRSELRAIEANLQTKIRDPRFL